MCRRFVQAQALEEYLTYIADEAERDIAYGRKPTGRYDAAPSTKV